ncbi:MAG: ribonuclease HII [Candidatus Moranbacteria bacterium]|nr:ribonuclease HII [Candidatus Moranbacteria bacterium]
MKISTFELEKQTSQKYDFIIGLDEVGRGPLAGPVVAGAAILKDFNSINFEDELWDLVRDSKTLSEKQREKVVNFVMENFFVGLGICNHETIDRMNILQASFLAMKKAFTDLKKQIKNFSNLSNSFDDTGFATRFETFEDKKTILLLDGNQYIPNLTVEQKCIPQGDKKVKSISAASIIAKVARDKMMINFSEKYPEYSFEKHKGYGTKIHMESLQKFGPCEIHRKSFKPVARFL